MNLPDFARGGTADLYSGYLITELPDGRIVRTGWKIRREPQKPSDTLDTINRVEKKLDTWEPKT